MFAAQKAKIVERVLSSPAERLDVIDLQMSGRPASDAVPADVRALPATTSEHGVAYTGGDISGSRA